MEATTFNQEDFSDLPKRRMGIKINKEPVKKMFESLLNDLRENFGRCRYRKCLREITTHQAIYKGYYDSWKIQEIKINCVFRIIHRKLKKNSNPASKLEDWFHYADEEVAVWFKIEKLFKNETDDLSEEDKIYRSSLSVKFLLLQCYYSALKEANFNNLQNSVAYLGLAERLIKYSVEFSNDFETLILSQKILLMISSAMIADNDFYTAKIYLAQSLGLSFKTLLLEYEIDDKVGLETINKKNEKVFMNIVAAFYQIGVCEEHMGNLLKVIRAYRQAKWFSQKFFNGSNSDLANFILGLEKRAIDYNTLVEAIKKAQLTFKVTKKDEKIKINTGFNKLEYQKEKKFNETKKIIEKVKLDESEEDEEFEGKSERVNKIMNTVHMIDSLMSPNFREIVKEMDKITINDLKKETKEKIKKKVKEIKIEKIIEKKQKIKLIEKKKQNITRDKQNNFKITDPNSPFSQTYFSTKPSTIFPLSTVSKKMNSLSKLDKINKYDHNDYIFDSKFRAKINHLDKLSQKELNFQKKLLGLKKHEHFIVDDFNEKKVKENCENFFKKVLLEKNEFLKENDEDDKKKVIIKKEEVNKSEIQQQKIETEVFKSVSIKSLEKLNKFKRNKNFNFSKFEFESGDINKLFTNNEELEKNYEDQVIKIIRMEGCLKDQFKPKNKIKPKPIFKIKENLEDFLFFET